MRLYTKILIAAAAITAVTAAISKLFCNYAIGNGKRVFNVSGGFAENDILSPDQKKFADLVQTIRRNYSEWFTDNAEDVNLLTNDGIKVHALLLQTDEPSKKYAILCHGYRDCAADVGYEASHFHKMGYNVLAVDGRISGGTHGRCIGMGWLERNDLKGYINFITARDPQAHILLYGISMGAAEVMMAAGESLPSNVKLIIEDCGYTSVYDIFRCIMNTKLSLPVHPLIDIASLYCKIVYGYGFREASAVKALQKSSLPILFIHGDNDNFVPTQMVHTLYDAAAGEKELFIVENAGHLQSSFVDTDAYWAKVKEFSDKYI